MGATADVLRAFRAHKSGAKRRGIDFRFSLPEWWDWWRTGNRWARRGRDRGGLVMARPRDRGAYEPGNVVPFSPGENFRDRPRHHIARPVLTPAGVFASAVQAAKAFGLTAAGASRRARAGSKGWRYADDRDGDAEAAV